MQISPCTLKMRVKEPQNRAPCFATFLQNELNNDVACFTTLVQTCIVTKEVVAGCEKLLQKVESSSTFCNKICTCSGLEVIFLGHLQSFASKIFFD